MFKQGLIIPPCCTEIEYVGTPLPPITCYADFLLHVLNIKVEYLIWSCIKHIIAQFALPNFV